MIPLHTVGGFADEFTKIASIKSKLLKGLGIAAGVGMGAAVIKGAKTWADPSFRRMVFKQNPKKKDLEKAFQSYEKETGKSRNEMSFKDISKRLK